jgi:hypothetical protein
MTGQFPAPDPGDDDPPPSLTLVLPPGLDGDEILAGLALAIGQARVMMAGWVRLSQQRFRECAARGDELGQAVCRGRILSGEHAVALIDENIIELFDLWDQYEAQLPGLGEGPAAGAGERANPTPGAVRPPPQPPEG